MTADTARSMSPAEFNALAARMWGDRFGPQAAAGLGLSLRSIRNYSDAKRPVHQAIPARMRAAALARMAVLQTVVDDCSQILGVPTTTHLDPVAPALGTGTGKGVKVAESEDV